MGLHDLLSDLVVVTFGGGHGDVLDDVVLTDRGRRGVNDRDHSVFLYRLDVWTLSGKLEKLADQFQIAPKHLSSHLFIFNLK